MTTPKSRKEFRESPIFKGDHDMLELVCENHEVICYSAKSGIYAARKIGTKGYFLFRDESLIGVDDPLRGMVDQNKMKYEFISSGYPAHGASFRLGVPNAQLRIRFFDQATAMLIDYLSFYDHLPEEVEVKHD